MKTVQIVINGLVDTTTITCPHCARSKSVPNAKLREFDRPLKVKCSCGQVFALSPNHRRFIRVAVDLDGQLSTHDSPSILAKVKVVDLSLSGVGFKAPGAAFEVGQTLALTFYLDDAAKTPITEDVVIQNMRGDVVGAEFVNQDTYNFDLDFYLMDKREH